MEALALPEGDPVYEVSIRGWGSQKEVQQVRVGAVPAANETAIQVRAPGFFRIYYAGVDCTIVGGN